MSKIRQKPYDSFRERATTITVPWKVGDWCWTLHEAPENYEPQKCQECGGVGALDIARRDGSIVRVDRCSKCRGTGTVQEKTGEKVYWTQLVQVTYMLLIQQQWDRDIPSEYRLHVSQVFSDGSVSSSGHQSDKFLVGGYTKEPPFLELFETEAQAIHYGQSKGWVVKTALKSKVPEDVPRAEAPQ